MRKPASLKRRGGWRHDTRLLQPDAVSQAGHIVVDTATMARDKRAAGRPVDLTGLPSDRVRRGEVETGPEGPTIAWDRP